MRILSIISVILLLWTTKKQSEATLPGIFLLPFMPLPKTTQKVPLLSPRFTPTRAPALLSQVQVIHISTTKSPTVQYQDVVKLHRLLEQTQHSNFASSPSEEKTQEQHNTFHHLNSEAAGVQQSQPQLQTTLNPPEQPELPNVASPPQQPQFEALATNQGPPQKATAYHQPVPLTFPPSDSSSDSYRLPRVISLPPLQPPQQHQQQQQQQQLPQSSSHYTTSSLSYSFAQGYNSQQSYGPPKSTKIVRHVSVFVAPPESGYGGGSQGRQKIRVQGETEKHVNIIFIKSPDSGQSNTVSEIDLPPSPEQKTYVYVLNKAQDDGQSQVVVNKPEPPKYNPPDVYFIKYKDGQKQGGQQQYGVPSQPPQQSYGPPQQQPPPPPQQIYGIPLQPPQQQPPQPPQQSYGPPQQQPPQQTYGSPPQQQPPPSSEYGVAPSNQNFNYTLPSSSHSISLIASLNLNGSKPFENGSASNNSFTINLTRASQKSEDKIISADRRIEEETHYHVHNLNYVTSHSHHQEGYDDEDENSIERQLENSIPKKGIKGNLGQQDKQNETGTGTGSGLYTQLSRDMESNEPIKESNDWSSSSKSPLRPNNDELVNSGGKEKVASTVLEKVVPSSTTPTTTTTMMPPTPTAIKKYNAIADIIGNIRVVLPESKTLPNRRNGMNHERGYNHANENIDDSTKDVEKGGHKQGDIPDDDDIIILTKRNLTLLTSGDFGKEDEAKEGEKGSPRNISGRPDDFRPYQYAPAMDHYYFGVSLYKNI